MDAELVSVNVGLPAVVDTARGPVETAIFKKPTEARLRVDHLNIDGDRQADLVDHGGQNKAVYCYPVEHYRVWAEELNRSDFEHGQFGENLTTRGLLESEVQIGDIFRVGTCVVQVTQPRAPCFKLGIRMGDPLFVKRFLKSGLLGFYLRVVEPGELGLGDRIERLERGQTGLSVHDVWSLSYGERNDRERLQLALGIDTLAEEWTRPLQKKLSRQIGG